MFQEIVAPLAVMFEEVTALITGGVVSELVVTTTVADAAMLGFEVHAALTVYVPAAAGAVYSPVLFTEPPVADHVIVSRLPVTRAVNCKVVPVGTLTLAGLIDTTAPMLRTDIITLLTAAMLSTSDAFTSNG